MNVARKSDSPEGAELEQRVTDGLYTLGIQMSGPKSGHATGVVVLQDGRIMGGDSFVHQHTEAPGLNLVCGRREVPYGFTGTYSDGFADIDGTALVGSYSIPFRARLALKSPM